LSLLINVCKFGNAEHEIKMFHAATVQAFSIGLLLTTLPIIRQHGFDMAFTVSTSWHRSHIVPIQLYNHSPSNWLLPCCNPEN